MDEIDRKILNNLQKDFPVSTRPYQTLGRKLGCSEEDVFSRVKKMKRAGLIRRLGASFDSRKLGFKSTLVGMKVPAKRLKRVISIVNKYEGVTHNYLREDKFNLWFTLIAPSQEAIESILHQIRGKSGIDEILNLPAKRLFKISVNFNV